MERHRVSGKTLKEICEQEGLNEGTLTWWRREIAKRDQEGRVAQLFIPVTCNDAAETLQLLASTVVEIDLDKRALRIFNGVDVQT